MVAHLQVREHAHPGPTTYVAVAAVLAVITLIEVWVYYQEALHGVLVPTLLALSAFKFSMVALFFMHLKFDSRIFSVLFVGGLALAVAVLIALVSLFSNFYVGNI